MMGSVRVGPHKFCDLGGPSGTAGFRSAGVTALSIDWAWQTRSNSLLVRGCALAASHRGRGLRPCSDNVVRLSGVHVLSPEVEKLEGQVLRELQCGGEREGDEGDPKRGSEVETAVSQRQVSE